MVSSDGDRDYCEVVAVDDLTSATLCLDALVVAAGFEDRAFRVLPDGKFSPAAHCILVRFENSVPGNEQVFERYLDAASRKFGSGCVHIVSLRHGQPAAFEIDLAKTIAELPVGIRTFGIDISGLPSFSICIALKTVRDSRPEEAVYVLYTAAFEYNPSFPEYKELAKRSPHGIELVSESMALEMAENLVLDSFSGYRSENAKSCLAVFAGYEVHRSTGVIEAVNPALLLLMYGNPGNASLAWRLDLSRNLHQKFEKGRRTATAVVSTLHLEEALEVLENYYNYLIDDYDLVIAPICSKMHVVASYLFWERYGEIQLTFPIPIGYDPSKSPHGIGGTYRTRIEPRRRTFRASSPQTTETQLPRQAST